MPLFLVVVHFVHTMPESFATHLNIRGQLNTFFLIQFVSLFYPDLSTRGKGSSLRLYIYLQKVKKNTVCIKKNNVVYQV